MGSVPTNAEASDVPTGSYGGGPGVYDGGNAAGDGGVSEGPDAGGVDSGNAAGGGADANPGAEGSGALSGNVAPNEGDAAEDNSAPNGGADQPEGVDGNEDADATAAGPEDEANGTGKSTDNADVNEGASGIDGNGAGSNGKASDGDEASARAGLSGAFKNMSKACKAISAQMLSIAFAPLTYSYGGGRAEAKQAVSELTQLKKKVPAELRDDFDKVEEVFAESGHAYSNFDEAAFEEAVIPIEEWVLENCPKLH
ncbi:hypothetical protein [Arthrobacter sp. H14]|uniref:hypothetical protein n=1 Tax=Arthrobacter sp. H14 TaxID=1312959 RepID=UPI0004AD5A48|nr:hypothetical protein [Arthrobacter sp. H14]